jgi:imidazoleglycerol phosphate dehydratase HisB
MIIKGQTVTHFIEWCHAGFGFRPNLLKQLSRLIVIAGIALMTGLGYTHPLGNFSINRYSCLEPGIDELVIYYVVDMAEIAALQEKGAIDTDQNGEIDKEESSRYLDQKAEALRLGLSVQMNEKPARLEIIEKEISYPTGWRH